MRPCFPYEHSLTQIAQPNIMLEKREPHLAHSAP